MDNNLDINELIERLKKKDSEAWNMMIDRYSKKIYNFVLNFAGSRDDASDITQDIFLKVYNNIDKFKEDRSFVSWLLTLSKNYCIDYWRKYKNTRYKVELNDNIHSQLEDTPGSGFGTVTPRQTPEENTMRNDEITYLRSKLLLLPPDLRMLIIMRDIQDYSYQEISQHFKIPLGTTKSRINRARAKLAKILVEEKEKFTGKEG